MPPICRLPLPCFLALAALSAHAADQWSNDYVVPQATPAARSASIPQPGLAQLCRTGNRVEAQSAGQWYEARILGADPHYQTCDVTYTGFGKHFDETVSLRRVRPYTGNVTPPPKPAKPATGQGQHRRDIPAGTAPICSSIPRSDGMGNTSYCY